MQADLHQRCLELMPHVLAKYGWQLIEDESAFIDEALIEAQSRLPNHRRTLEQVIADAIVNRYNHLWYAACRENNTLRQRRALEELHRYLFRAALYKTNPDRFMAEECAQEALILAWQRLHQVRDAGAFMRWASMILINLMKRKLAKPSQEDELDRSEEDSDEQPPQPSPLDTQPAAPAPSQLTQDSRTRLEAAIRKCLSSEQQVAVIIGLFLDERAFIELADQLNSSVANISVLKSRALDKLRECDDFMNIVEDLL
jgi:RNA polymerase sigma factor (sigma-70 family)